MIEIHQSFLCLIGSRMTWLVNGKTIARKVKNRHHGVDGQDHLNCERCIECPCCGNVCEERNRIVPAWPGLPAGVKFDPSDQEILEHLAAKLGRGEAKPHPYIDVFIPTLDEEGGVYCTHPEKLPDVKRDGNCIHYFHRPRKAYMTGTRKRRKVEDVGNKGFELRWHKTGKTRPVMGNRKQLGFKKIMVLYTGSGKQTGGLGKTNWIMHQYHIGMHEEEKEGEYVVAKIFYQTQPRQWASSRLKTEDGDDHHLYSEALPRDQLPEEPTASHSNVYNMMNMAEDTSGMTVYANPVDERHQGLFKTLSEDAQRMWAESFLQSFQQKINIPGQSVAPIVAHSEQGESSSRHKVELQRRDLSMPDVAISGKMVTQMDPIENSSKVSETHLFNLLANKDIKAALRGKSEDGNTECNVLENACEEDVANKFEALENIILESPPDFIIESLLQSQEALDALELFKSWSDSQKGWDSFTDLFK